MCKPDANVVTALLRKISTVELWQDTYPDGPDIIGGGPASAFLTADDVRTARAALAALRLEAPAKGGETIGSLRSLAEASSAQLRLLNQTEQDERLERAATIIDRLLATPSRDLATAPGGEEPWPSGLSVSDCDLLMRQMGRLSDLSEVWYEEARQANAERNKPNELLFMRLMNVFIVAENSLKAAVRASAPEGYFPRRREQYDPPRSNPLPAASSREGGWK